MNVLGLILLLGGHFVTFGQNLACGDPRAADAWGLKSKQLGVRYSAQETRSSVLTRQAEPEQQQKNTPEARCEDLENQSGSANLTPETFYDMISFMDHETDTTRMKQWAIIVRNHTVGFFSENEKKY